MLPPPLRASAAEPKFKQAAWCAPISPAFCPAVGKDLVAMQAAQPDSGAVGQPGAAAAALAPAAPAALEEGFDEDLFMQLAAAAEEDDAAAAGGSGGGGGGQASKSGGSAGPRLSWAAKAATAGIAGAVPPGHKPRQAVVLAPGAIPRVAPPPPTALLPPSSQASSAPTSRGVATFGAPAPSAAAAGGTAAKGGFADVGQGSLVERYAGLKVRCMWVLWLVLRWVCMCLGGGWEHACFPRSALLHITGWRSASTDCA